jgi:signal peptidase I
MTNDDPLAPGPEDRGDALRSARAEARARRARERRKAAIEWTMAIVMAVVVAFTVKAWIAQTFVIPSGSMEDTLQVNDRVLVSKLSYRFGPVDRGDVIVFDNPECADRQGACEYAQLIKRVVGVAGDEVSARDGVLMVNGEVLPEPYLKPGSTTRMPGACTVYDDDEMVTIGPGELLVMGDNRNLSKDGRCFGPVGVDRVVGKAFIRVWPVSRIGGL